MSTVFLIHGIRAKDKGKASMKSLLMSLNRRGITKARIVSYGYVLIPITNKHAVKQTIKAIEELPEGTRLTLVGYSNGGWTAVQVAEMGYRVDHLVLISPALYAYHEIPRHVKTVDVFHCNEDMVLTLAKWYRWLNRLLPWRWFNRHEWGEAGRVGLLQDDDRITNHEITGTGHFFYEHPDVVDVIAKRIKQVEEE